MMRAGQFIIKQSKVLLENKQQALLFAVIFSILPLAAWLSVSLVALVTLRRGSRAGFEVLLPALIMHSVPLMMMVSLGSALINTLVAYIPCYVAAIYLRNTSNWHVVSIVFLLQALCVFIPMQVFAPDFTVNQLTHFKQLLSHYPEYAQSLSASTQDISSFLLAQLFLGFQVLSVVFSALLSLLFARSIQAKLFVPGGLKAELTNFRSGRPGFFILMAVSLGSYYEIACAINVLPLILVYFFLSGLNLIYFLVMNKWSRRVLLLLILLSILQPILVFCAFFILGSLDSLFNFRLYLPPRARESI